MPITHDDLLDILRNDISQAIKLDERRQAVETYTILVDTVIKYDSAYEYYPEPAITEPEIDRLYILECHQ